MAAPPVPVCYLFARRAGGGFSSPVKVGITGGLVLSRLRTVQTGNHVPLGVVFTFPFDSLGAAARIEAEFHAKHKRRRLHGEWFSMDPAAALEELAGLVESASYAALHRGVAYSDRLACEADSLRHGVVGAYSAAFDLRGAGR